MRQSPFRDERVHATFDVHKVLETVGPTASLLFAAWIFLQYLNQRFTESLKRLRELSEDLRTATRDDDRSGSVRQQLRLYRRRCRLMRRATDVGLTAAILLLTTLTLAALQTVIDGPDWLEPVAVCAAIGGSLVVAATVMVILENRLVGTTLRAELSDLSLDDDR